MKAKDMLSYVGFGIFIAIFLVGFVVLPAANSSTRVYTVVSGSMEPALNLGDVVFVERTSPKNIDQGDIITFERDGKTVTHRCIEIIHNPDGKRYFQTKGDANEEPDADLVPEGKLIGKIPSLELLGHTIYLKVPRLGYLSHFLHTFQGYILLIVIPSLLLIGIEVYDVSILLFSEGEIETSKNKA